MRRGGHGRGAVACPAPEDLPAPPADRRGWPWTLAGVTPPAEGAAAQPPAITVVVPCLNGGAFLEEALRSLLLQGYPALQVVVMDGGSTDATVDLLQRYGAWLDHWESGPDAGQSDAISRGLERAVGSLANWLNADDRLLPGALWEVARAVGARAELVVGRAESVDAGTGDVVRVWEARPFTGPGDFLRPHGVVMAQPATFFDPALVARLGGVRRDLHYVMDWELYLRMAARCRRDLHVARTDAVLARALLHPGAKTVAASPRFLAEARQVLAGMDPWLTPLERARAWRWHRRQRVWDALAAVRAQGGGVAGLVGVAVGAPDALTMRPWWGALRRGGRG